MTSTTHDERDGEGVRFVHEDDGRITAVDEETGVASFGETKAEALRMLAEALELHEGGGEPVADADLREMGDRPGRCAGRRDGAGRAVVRRRRRVA
jgi:predicted RNase H-like HicB family nuclease